MSYLVSWKPRGDRESLHQSIAQAQLALHDQDSPSAQPTLLNPKLINLTEREDPRVGPRRTPPPTISALGPGPPRHPSTSSILQLFGFQGLNMGLGGSKRPEVRRLGWQLWPGGRYNPRFESPPSSLTGSPSLRALISFLF